MNAGSTVESVKVVKSPAELEYIRQAAEISTAGMEAAIDIAAEGKNRQ